MIANLSENFKWYYDNGYITARDGNCAVRAPSRMMRRVQGKNVYEWVENKDWYYVTMSGDAKNRMHDSLSAILVDNTGRNIDDRLGYGPGHRKTSIETGAHIAALSQSGKYASVHVHSPNTVALAALFEPHGGFRPQSHDLIHVLNTKWPELFRYTRVGHMVPFLTPGSSLLHDSIVSSLGRWEDEPIVNPDDPNDVIGLKEVKKWNDICIMQRHGVLAIGDSLDQCMEHIVRLEHISTILLKIITASGNLESIL
jgi:ribulose-5-phosphate 4-epimerase/fuculose-1-phosphate aldolase